jgi:prepilin peptidase CpaA
MPINAQIIWISALAFSFPAGVIDWRTRKIPNWLTVSGFAIGVGIHAWLAGWHGVLTSLEGTGLALGILLPLVLLRALGAGDWKLMGAIGALLGPVMMLFVLLASIVVTAGMAVLRMMQAGRVKSTLVNVVTLVKGFATFGLKPNPKISLDNPQLMKVPFGVGAAIGTLICFVAAQLVK